MVSKWLRFLILGPILLLLLVVYLSWLPSEPGFIVPVVGAFSFAGFVLISVFSVSYACVLLGISLCVLPFFHWWGVLVFVVVWLLGYEFRLLYPSLGVTERVYGAQKLVLLAFLSFLLAYLLGVLRVLLLDCDIFLFSTVYQGGGILAVIRYLIRGFHSWGHIPTDVAAYVVSMFLVISLSSLGRREAGVFLGLFNGIAVGVLLAAVVLFMQVAEVAPIFSYNRSSFWILTGRRAGTFSDPNAFGVAVSLLAPSLLVLGRGWRRVAYFFCSLLFLIAGFWSGSRALWFGLSVWLLCFFIVSLRSSRSRLLRAVLSMGLLGLPLVLVCAGYPPFNEKLTEHASAPAAERLLRTLNWESAREMFASRELYWGFALRAWKEHPIVGLGLGKFYEEQQRIGEAAGVDLSTWRDNTNNFYLQVLAEQGLLGLLLVLYAFYQCACALSGRILSERFGNDSKYFAAAGRCVLVSKCALVVFLSMLITGPHLHFPEIRLIAAVFLAFGLANVETCYDARIPRRVQEVLLITLLCPIVFMLFTVGDFERIRNVGLYQKEHTDVDGFFVWTARQAKVSLCPGKEKTVPITLRALNPDLEQRPLTVRLRLKSQRQSYTDVILRDSAWKTIELQRPEEAIEPEILELVSSRIWSPSQLSLEGDSRWFGVMLKWPESLCHEGVK